MGAAACQVACTCCEPAGRRSVVSRRARRRRRRKPSTLSTSIHGHCSLQQGGHPCKAPTRCLLRWPHVRRGRRCPRPRRQLCLRPTLACRSFGKRAHGMVETEWTAHSACGAVTATNSRYNPHQHAYAAARGLDCRAGSLQRRRLRICCVTAIAAVSPQQCPSQHAAPNPATLCPGQGDSYGPLQARGCARRARHCCKR